MQNDFTKSLRLPLSWNEHLTQYAQKNGVSASCVYRRAISQFLSKNTQAGASA